MTCYAVIQWANNLNLEKYTDLYSFYSGFAEVPLHLNIDLYVANIAGGHKNKISTTIMPHKSCNKEMTETLKSEE